MTSMVFHTRSDPDGKLHLDVPVGQADTDFEVEVVVRARGEARSLPPGYFNLLGSVDDETLTVHPAPPMPPPVDFE